MSVAVLAATPPAPPPPKAAESAVYTVAVVGQPNTGKSTLFNALTGLRQRVGNYPGVTVERKTGRARLDENCWVELIDLPGTYSLAARSPDEMIAVDVLLGQQAGVPRPDAILAIVDASTPERNFYLLSQLCELGLPLVVALNMTDLAERKGLFIDARKLSAVLGTPVVAICAHKGTGLEELRDSLLQVLRHKRPPTGARPEFPVSMQTEASGLHDELLLHAGKLGRQVSRVEAFRVLVDKGGWAELRLQGAIGNGFHQGLEARRRRASRIPLPAEEVRARYGWAKRVLEGVLTRPAQPRHNPSERIDRVLTHRYLGSIILAAFMLLLFQSIFCWARPAMELISRAFAALAAGVEQHLADGALKSLLCHGVLGGVGGVLVFLPQICILFFFIAVLEDCGYMARAAFLMDRLLACVGLSGKSFIPMLSSFACGVPAVMATRTIESPRDRLATILITPLMSCSARLPVYTMMIAAFIPATTYAGGWLSLRGLTLFAMYSLGPLLAAPLAWLLKKTVLRGEAPPFLFELPSYKIPDWKGVALRVYDRGKAFVVRAGTIILAVSIVVWALSYFPHPAEIAAQAAAARAELERDGTLSDEKRAGLLESLNQAEKGDYLRQSYFGRMGRVVEPVFKPLGWDWRISMAALASFPAREVVVATLDTIFDSGQPLTLPSPQGGEGRVGGAGGHYASLRHVTWTGSDRLLFTVPVALSIMVFFALCMQCAATLAVIRRETNSMRWPLFSFASMTALAYVAALATYQAATWLGC